MAERQAPPPLPDIERALTDLGAHLSYPPAPDLARAVRHRLETEAPPSPLPAISGTFFRARLLRSQWRRVAAGLLVAALILGALLVFSPGARASVTSWLRLHGVLIELAPGAPTPAPPPIGTPLQLGRRLSLAAAQAKVPLTIRVPAALGTPDDKVYLGGPHNAQVALVYRPRAGLPRAPHTHVGLLLTEFQSAIEPYFLKKVIGLGTHVDFISVSGARAFWLYGAPHFFDYVDSGGRVTAEMLRLAGNTLLWERGGITYRLEAAVSRARALSIAASMR